MARPDDVVSDGTPLDGPRIDVPSRIGWLLRTSRAASGVSLASMSTALGAAGLRLSASVLSRAETSGVRDTALLGHYESVLGLVPGRLRAPVDILCRTFHYAPSERPGSAAPVADLASFDAALEPVLTGRPTGGDWLTFAHAHGAGRFGLPTRLIEPLVDTLVSEMGRSVGTAFATRYEALAVLRCNAYAPVVSASVTRLVEAPDTQVMLDAVIAVAELPTPRLLDWAAGKLSDPSETVARAGALALENMRNVGGLDPTTWARLHDPFLAAYALEEPWRREMLTLLFKNLPPTLRSSIRPGLDGAALAPVRAPADWTADRRNLHYGIAEDLARKVSAEAGVPHQPMLARLLFELLYDFRSTRAACAAYFLAASAFIVPLFDELVALAAQDPDTTTLHGIAYALPQVQSSAVTTRLDAWLTSDDPVLVGNALAVAGHHGDQVPVDVLERHLPGPTRKRALYAAGMSAHPCLEGWCEHADPAVRGGARWWLEQGSRLVD